MKRSVIVAVAMLSGALAVFVTRRAPISATRQLEPEPVVGPSAVASAPSNVAQLPPPPAKAVATTRPIDVPPPARTADLVGMLAATDLRSPETLRAALKVLRERHDEAAPAIIALYKSAPLDEPGRRERALWFAGKLKDPALVPLWEDVLRRTTPEFSDEEAIVAQKNPHDSRVRAIRDERLLAISGLGAVQVSSPAAQKLLRGVAHAELGKVPPLDVGLRTDAVRELHSENRLELLRSARALPAGDPLLDVLRSLAVEERKRRQKP